jgi:hypothetical protein
LEFRNDETEYDMSTEIIANEYFENIMLVMSFKWALATCVSSKFMVQRNEM